MSDQPPISSYGLIGDLRTAALVGLRRGGLVLPATVR